MRSLVLAGLLCFVRFCTAQVQLRAYAITGVTVIDASRAKAVPHQTVEIVDGKIASVFDDGAFPLPDSVSVIRATGKYLIPGLIDTHVHLATDPSGVDNRASTLRVLQRMLYSGMRGHWPGFRGMRRQGISFRPISIIPR